MERGRHHVVFDIGGTSLRAGLYDPAAGVLTAQRSAATPSRETLPGADAARIQAELLDAMEQMARALSGGQAPGLIAAAFPGPVDGQGEVSSCPTVWGDLDPRPFPARAALARRFPGAEVLVLNDVTAAGYRFVEKGDETLCVVTVSSGVGHKIFLDGRPAVGPRGRGGEIGHLRVNPSPDAPRCDCGGRGHLGAIASGRGALAAARRRAEDDPAAFARSVLGKRLGSAPFALENPALVGAFLAGDAWARAVIADAARPLGGALAALHLAVGVERFILIGGFALALGEDYRALVARAAAEGGWSPGLAWDALISLGDAAEPIGLLGAGRFATLQRGDGARGGIARLENEAR